MSPTTTHGCKTWFASNHFSESCKKMFRTIGRWVIDHYHRKLLRTWYDKMKHQNIKTEIVSQIFHLYLIFFVNKKYYSTSFCFMVWCEKSLVARYFVCNWNLATPQQSKECHVMNGIWLQTISLPWTWPKWEKRPKFQRLRDMNLQRIPAPMFVIPWTSHGSVRQKLCCQQNFPRMERHA